MAAACLPATRSHDAKWLFFFVVYYISLSYEADAGFWIIDPDVPCFKLSGIQRQIPGPTPPSSISAHMGV